MRFPVVFVLRRVRSLSYPYTTAHDTIEHLLRSRLIQAPWKIVISISMARRARIRNIPQQHPMGALNMHIFSNINVWLFLAF